MDIVVLVKQVPDTESMVQIAGDGASIKKDDIKWVMNPYDELAVEEALRIKEAKGGSVTIVSVGPQKTQETIRTALAMGADKGIHINDPLAEGSDSLATAKILAAAVKTLPFNLIIAGQRAVDEDNYQVGAAVAELLGIPHVSLVIQGRNPRREDPLPARRGRRHRGGGGDPSGPLHDAARFERAPLRIASRHHEGQEEAPGGQDPRGPGPGPRHGRRRPPQGGRQGAAAAAGAQGRAHDPGGDASGDRR